MEILDPTYDSVVIGAGQAGLSASYHLSRRGLVHVVLDADAAPGGAWQHRWDSLTMRDVHGVAALPDSVSPTEESGRANAVVPAYFERYEREHDLPEPGLPGPGQRGVEQGGAPVGQQLLGLAEPT